MEGLSSDTIKTAFINVENVAAFEVLPLGEISDATASMAYFAGKISDPPEIEPISPVGIANYERKTRFVGGEFFGGLSINTMQGFFDIVVMESPVTGILHMYLPDRQQGNNPFLSLTYDPNHNYINFRVPESSRETLNLEELLRAVSTGLLDASRQVPITPEHVSGMIPMDWDRDE